VVSHLKTWILSHWIYFWVSVSILLACEQFNPCCTLGATSLMVSSVSMWGFDCEYTVVSAVVVSMRVSSMFALSVSRVG